jgi:hypothetical protein
VTIIYAHTIVSSMCFTVLYVLLWSVTYYRNASQVEVYYNFCHAVADADKEAILDVLHAVLDLTL